MSQFTIMSEGLLVFKYARTNVQNLELLPYFFLKCTKSQTDIWVKQSVTCLWNVWNGLHFVKITNKVPFQFETLLKCMHTCNNTSSQKQPILDLIFFLITFSFSFFLVSSVSLGLSWRVRWCQKSPSQGPAARALRTTTDDWRHGSDSFSNARSQLRSPGVWLWWGKIQGHKREEHI